MGGILRPGPMWKRFRNARSGCEVFSNYRPFQFHQTLSAGRTLKWESKLSRSSKKASRRHAEVGIKTSERHVPFWARQIGFTKSDGGSGCKPPVEDMDKVGNLIDDDDGIREKTVAKCRRGSTRRARGLRIEAVAETRPIQPSNLTNVPRREEGGRWRRMTEIGV